MNYLRYPFYICIWGVALMSGPLSIVREFLAIINPQKFQTQEAFWHWVFIAFIISSISLVVIQHRRINALHKNVPNLHADFNVFAVAPAGEKDEDTILAITALITNTGTPSIVKNIGVLVKTNAGSINGQSILLDQRGSKFEGIIGGQKIELVATFEDHLVRKCSNQPILTGGGANGVHVVLLPGIPNNQIHSSGTAIILSFEDVTGKKYEFKEVSTGEIHQPVNPMTLQKHND